MRTRGRLMVSTAAAAVALLLMTGVGGNRVHAQSGPKVIEITAKRFGFAPNNVTLRKGETVTLRLTTADVTHGFFSKPLKIDEVIEPGKETDVTLTPSAAGTYTTICDHFCGAGHGNMSMTIVVTD